MAAEPADTGSSKPGSSSSMADVYKGELTPLQRHVAFFDRDKDGVIYPSETYEGFRAIGAGVSLSAFSALFINGLLGPKTVPENEKAPAFKLPIYVKNIHKGKHGSDSGVYDANGRFVPEKFEEIFKKHAHTRPDALTGKELQELLKANREPKDFKGWLGGFTEWKVLYSLCKDEKGFLHKDTVRAVYDGSLFERLEKERKFKESTKKKC
ncbi:probable peroxygenase 4 [Panicum virgatum]|uniref:Peroxygenase 4 n=2 Tax=Panicum virgatum TaxID=38727 RepID=A0A8T0T1X8_PANVG|nr:probable peroxygenase 4 [Panicum virgatum]KAG2605141.1 hypothetical protein PVAP13_4NG113300 [Panicum virgatum]